MSKHSDLDYAQHYLILLTDLLAKEEGGRSRPSAVAQIGLLRREAKGALSDLMWHDHLDDLMTFAQAFLSDQEHAGWAKRDLTDIEYLGVEILKTLNQLATRLTILRSRRESDSLAETASAAS